MGTSSQPVEPGGKTQHAPALSGWRWSVLWGRRARPIWIMLLAGWLIFGLFRALLLISVRGELAGLGTAVKAYCFVVGLRFDSVAIGMAILPMALVLPLAPPAAFDRRWFRRLLAGYAALLLTVGLLVELVGYFFFERYGIRLNYQVWDNLGAFPELIHYIWRHYPLAWVLLGLAVFLLAAHWLTMRVFWAGQPPRERPAIRWALAAGMLAIMIFLIRGGFANQPVELPDAHYCNNATLAQLAQNNFFTLGHAARSRLEELQVDPFRKFLPPPDQVAQRVRGMLMQKLDTPAGRQDNPLWRQSRWAGPPKDWNVVLIQMEGMAGRPVGMLGNSPSHTPELDRIAVEGIACRRMFPSGTRTCNALVSVLCGVPDMHGLSVLKRWRGPGRVLTLPEVFRRNGYSTMIISGGRADFDNMQEFFTGGVQSFVCEEQMRSSAGAELMSDWGYHDEVIFRRANEEFRKMGERRFFAAIVTISNHEPYEVPAGRCQTLPASSPRSDEMNAFRYADWAIGEFFRQASREAYFKKTLFVLVGDHGRKLENYRPDEVDGHRVACVFYAPGLVNPQTVDTVCGQVDLAPTILAMVGLPSRHGFMGRNILDVAPADGFAMNLAIERLMGVWDDGAIQVSPQHTCMLYRFDGLRLVLDDRAPEQSLLKPREAALLSYYRMSRDLHLSGGFGKE